MFNGNWCNLAVAGVTLKLEVTPAKCLKIKGWCNLCNLCNLFYSSMHVRTRACACAHVHAHVHGGAKKVSQVARLHRCNKRNGLHGVTLKERLHQRLHQH